MTIRLGEIYGINFKKTGGFHFYVAILMRGNYVYWLQGSSVKIKAPKACYGMEEKQETNYFEKKGYEFWDLKDYSGTNLPYKTVLGFFIVFTTLQDWELKGRICEREYYDILTWLHKKTLKWIISSKLTKETDLQFKDDERRRLMIKHDGKYNEWTANTDSIYEGLIDKNKTNKDD